MSPAWWAGAAVAALVLVTGRGSGFRLRSYGLPASQSAFPRGRWPRPRANRASSVVPSLGVPASLALELRAGRDLSAALGAVAEEVSDYPELTVRLQAAARVAATGGPVGPALVGPSDPLGRSLQVTARCCDVSASSGLALAEILEAVAREARSRLLLVGRAKAELAAARSTSVVLGCLPLVGLAMGQLLGAQPLHVLLSTEWGLGCLLVATVLTGIGALWSRAIARSATRSLP